MEGSREFEWDKHNQLHLARHGIHRSEAEDVLSGNHILLEDEMVGDEQRWIAVGSTRAGRILMIVFAVRNEAMRPITGWAADKEATALYFREWGPI
ncbi:MAG TPA: BrnT family toxin [Candidatus Eremiobacteraceae bacterium]|nr:BrnT family toxin [Candidatus Eremiobacteraceae bacterium]